MHRRDLLKLLSVSAASCIASHPRALPIPPVPTFTHSRRTGKFDLQKALEASIARNRVVGASAATWVDGELTTAAAGFTNVTTGIPMTPEAICHIGSITKVLNSTLVMQLVDEGSVDLDQPLVSYLPDFRVADPEATAAITVRMLLNHGSGIDGEILTDRGHDEETLEKAFARFAQMGQIHEPGRDLSYCNTAMVLAGYLAQRVTGTSWYDLVEQRLFKPLELEHAIVLPEDAILHRASVGHFLDPTTYQNKRTSHAFLPLSFAPAGSTAMLSARDLVHFAVAHMQDGEGANGEPILEPESAVEMRTPSNTYQGVGFSKFGLGWMLCEDGVIGHGGGGPGIVSWLYAHPESNSAIAVLTNSAHGSLVLNEVQREFLVERVGLDGLPLGRDSLRLARQIPTEPVAPERYVGTYESIASRIEVTPSAQGISLISQVKVAVYDSSNTERTAPIELRALGEDAFTVGPPPAEGAAAPAIFKFVNPDANGVCQHLATGGRLLKRVDQS